MDGHSRKFFKVHTSCVNLSRRRLSIVGQTIITKAKCALLAPKVFLYYKLFILILKIQETKSSCFCFTGCKTKICKCFKTGIVFLITIYYSYSLPKMPLFY